MRWRSLRDKAFGDPDLLSDCVIPFAFRSSGDGSRRVVFRENMRTQTRALRVVTLMLGVMVALVATVCLFVLLTGGVHDSAGRGILIKGAMGAAALGIAVISLYIRSKGMARAARVVDIDWEKGVATDQMIAPGKPSPYSARHAAAFLRVRVHPVLIRNLPFGLEVRAFAALLDLGPHCFAIAAHWDRSWLDRYLSTLPAPLRAVIEGDGEPIRAAAHVPVTALWRLRAASTRPDPPTSRSR